MVRTKATPRHAEVRPPKCVIYITRNPVTFVIQRHHDLFLLDQQVQERKYQAAYKQHVQQEGGKTYASLPMEMLQNIQKSPLFEKMQKDCKAEGIKIPKTLMAKDPVTHVLTPQEYLRNMEAGTMPPMDNHQMMKEMAENATVNNQTKFLMMEFRDIKRPTLSTTPKPQKCK